MRDLESYRQKLDQLDDELKRLLVERFSISLAIGEYKKELGLQVKDSGREAIILERFSDIEEEQLRDAIVGTYERIFLESKKLQKNL